MSFDVTTIRAKFPALAVRDGGRPRIYFDNPAGTFVAPNTLPPHTTTVPLLLRAVLW